MVDQAAAHRKTNPAFCADVRLFAAVNALVFVQAMFHRKPRPTYCTYIRPFACMRAPVKGQIALLSESRSTILTSIWSFSGVHAIVPGQMGWDTESIAAPRMVAHVLLFLNSSLHQMWRRRWGHMRLCMNCRSHMYHEALLTVGSHCLQIDANIQRSHNWWH